jgi:outer membrane protein
MRLGFIISFLVLFSSSFAQGGWDLQQCIKYATDHNISLKQGALNNQVILNNSTQSKAAILPSMNLGAQHTYNFGQTIDRFTNKFANTEVLSQNLFASSTLLLWSGLAQYNNIRATEFNYLSSVENLKQQEYNLSLNVANAFITVIFSDELLKISQNQYETSKQQLERTMLLVEAGSVAKSVGFDIKAQVANDELNLTTADNNYQIALLNLRQLMNYDSVASFNVLKPEIEIKADQLVINDVQHIYESALKTQPNIKGGEFAILSADRSYKASKGKISPTLSMTGLIGTGYSGLNKNITGYTSVPTNVGDIPGYGPLVVNQQVPVFGNAKPFLDQYKSNVNKSIGFSLNIPIFNGLQTNTAYKNARINLLNARYTQELNKQNLYKAIAQAYANAKAALNKYKASQASVDAATESFKYAEQKFNAGAINSFDFTTAKNRLFAAESNLLQAKYDYVFKLKVLDYYQGKPLTL